MSICAKSANKRGVDGEFICKKKNIWKFEKCYIGEYLYLVNVQNVNKINVFSAKSVSFYNDWNNVMAKYEEVT